MLPYAALVFLRANALETIPSSSVFASETPRPDRDPPPENSRRKQPNDLNNKMAGECQRTSPAETFQRPVPLPIQPLWMRRAPPSLPAMPSRAARRAAFQEGFER